jgi:D-serine deaminase-like pyridoxal phosphate-dependent protein
VLNLVEIKDLQTPCWLVDPDQLQANIDRFQAIANEHGKQLWPMIKTHKSTVIARLQKTAGAQGFLTGTLQESQVLLEQDLGPVMYAYPVAGEANLKRALEIGRMGRLILSVDGEANARQLSDVWQRFAKDVPNCPLQEVLMIIDSGLHRFGVQPERAGALGQIIDQLPGLQLIGIGTHPGQVYGAGNPSEARQAAKDAAAAMKAAYDNLKAAGFVIALVATGSTPTFMADSEDDLINTLRPGNYVFFDQTQVQLMEIPERQCALTVLATVVANPSEDLLMIDAGSKCLALDKGAHGTSAAADYGRIIGHPELSLFSLSEEVGRIRIDGYTDVKVGDQLRIIPNHTCPVANLADRLLLVRENLVIGTCQVDMKMKTNQDL